VSYYNRQGQPISMEECARLSRSNNYSWVAKSYLDGTDIYVSTVWLGVDHSFGEGQPLIFETIVFGDEHESCTRYGTEEAAIAGHREIVHFFNQEQQKDHVNVLVWSHETYYSDGSFNPPKEVEKVEEEDEIANRIEDILENE